MKLDSSGTGVLGLEGLVVLGRGVEEEVDSALTGLGEFIGVFSL